jgi:hypothetical protein
MQLIDWKSIELANMGTVEFKQQRRTQRQLKVS